MPLEFTILLLFVWCGLGLIPCFSLYTNVLLNIYYLEKVYSLKKTLLGCVGIGKEQSFSRSATNFNWIVIWTLAWLQNVNVMCAAECAASLSCLKKPTAVFLLLLQRSHHRASQKSLFAFKNVACSRWLILSHAFCQPDYRPLASVSPLSHACL